MDIECARFRFRGSIIETCWCSKAMIKDIVAVFQLRGRKLYGILAEPQSPLLRDWARTENLLWAHDDGSSLHMLQSEHQVPLLNGPHWPDCVERILAIHSFPDGQVCIGVKWKNDDVPTWEREENLLALLDSTAECLPAVLQRQLIDPL
ncbi:uncharacterized protein F5Z01DRAFT_631454 [Emericellopsis atlantica]|uniref:Chromo domain-containing protein n=1 Tax=Emericellopsis atlantica TaxID=2614577 RepID=A0A9P7ZD07_9HYPO|nr:uncharacterized protein F5Z01DRAFT_631454 [Emericellopsis atlantica]KAG9249562.1 hypothetical protein F5Z01DRAFT_631454 [Emericellopsis atlantica]